MAAAEAAVAQYDVNGNGEIEGDELNHVAAIKSALYQVDKNDDQRVSANEIAGRIDEWKRSRLGLIGCSVLVTLDGNPMEGATVSFVPEEFLGPNVRRAQGTTGPQGLAMLTIDDPDLKARRIGGVQCGFYRVEITAADDWQLIPDNAGTGGSLGEEVAETARCAHGVLKFEVKSEVRFAQQKKAAPDLAGQSR